MTLYKAVRHAMMANPNATNEEIFKLVTPLFPHDNPQWLNTTIQRYRSNFKKEVRLKTSSKCELPVNNPITEKEK